MVIVGLVLGLSRGIFLISSFEDLVCLGVEVYCCLVWWLILALTCITIIRIRRVAR